MIKVRNLSFAYQRNQSKVLDNLSFDLHRGKVLAVIGPSGGGKSTLLRLLAGLERPQSGEIHINQNVVASKDTFVEPEYRGVGMLFQDYALFPHMTIAKNIGFGLRNNNKNEKEQRICELLDLIGLQQYYHRYPHELSGGQQQRVALARAIAPNPKVLFLDEPFSNLDAELLENIREELFKIIDALKITTIMVTHHKEDAELFSDEILEIGSGFLKYSCKPIGG